MEKFLTPGEAMKMIRCKRTTMYHLISIPGFPAIRVGRKIIIPESDLIEWLKNGGADLREA